MAGTAAAITDQKEDCYSERTNQLSPPATILVLATANLLKPAHEVTRRIHTAIWTAFLLGIAVSPAANIASAPTLGWQPILVAGWPPITLLLAVELLARQPKPRPGSRDCSKIGVSGPRRMVAE